MTRRYRLISCLLGAALLSGCIVDNSGNDTQSAATTTTVSMTGVSLSGATSASPSVASYPSDGPRRDLSSLAFALLVPGNMRWRVSEFAGGFRLDFLPLTAKDRVRRRLDREEP